MFKILFTVRRYLTLSRVTKKREFVDIIASSKSHVMTRDQHKNEARKQLYIFYWQRKISPLRGHIQERRVIFIYNYNFINRRIFMRKQFRYKSFDVGDLQHVA